MQLHFKVHRWLIREGITEAAGVSNRKHAPSYRQNTYLASGDLHSVRSHKDTMNERLRFTLLVFMHTEMYGYNACKRLVTEMQASVWGWISNPRWTWCPIKYQHWKPDERTREEWNERRKSYLAFEEGLHKWSLIYSFWWSRMHPFSGFQNF